MATAGGWCPLTVHANDQADLASNLTANTAPPRRTSRALIATNHLRSIPKRGAAIPCPGTPSPRARSSGTSSRRLLAETELSPDLAASAAPLRARRLGLRRHHNHGGCHVRALDRRSARHFKAAERSRTHCRNERKAAVGRRAHPTSAAQPDGAAGERRPCSPPRRVQGRSRTRRRARADRRACVSSQLDELQGRAAPFAGLLHP